MKEARPQRQTRIFSPHPLPASLASISAGLLFAFTVSTALAGDNQHAAPATAAVQLLPPTPYEATYQARSRGLTTDAYRYLRVEEDGVYEVSHGLSLSVLGATLIRVEETSQFLWRDHGAMPLWYSYEQGGVRRRHEKVTFDWIAQQAEVDTDRGDYQIPVSAGVLDNLSFSTQMSAELQSRRTDPPIAVDEVLTFQIVDRDEIDIHDYRVTSYETIDTLMGPLNTVKLERIRAPESRRKTEIWLAPAYEYVLAKLVQTESNGSQTELVLKSFAHDLTGTAQN